MVQFGKEPLGANSGDIYGRLQEFLGDHDLLDPSTKKFSIKDISIDFPADDLTTPVTNNIFGYQTTSTNFSMGGVLMFRAPETGEYTFSTEDVTGGVIVAIMDTDWFMCCGIMGGEFEDGELDGLYTGHLFYNIPSEPQNSNNSYTTTLKEGYLYNIEFIYVNTEGSAGLKFTVTLPDGTTTTDFTGLGALPIAIDCDNFHTTSTAFSEWDSLSTTTYSTSIVTHDMTTTTTLETIYYVVTL